MTIDIWIACYLLLAHFVSDFVTQTVEMGLKKSSNIEILTKHIAFLTLALVVLLLPLVSPVMAVVIAFTNGAIHWVVDFATSRIAKKFYQEQRMYAFWKVIGIDQLIHTAVLLLTYSYLA